MGKYHSTVSRRDFIKTLGLGGVGLGVAAVAPIFHDLDEVMASSHAEFKRPSWVKEVEKTTVDIDWSRMERFDTTEVMWAQGPERQWGKEKADFIRRVGAANRDKWIKENKPGFNMKDFAFKSAAYAPPYYYLGPLTSPTPESLGVPRYEGTPEENARMVRAFLKIHGAATVGFLQLDTDTTEKMVFACDHLGNPYHIKDVDQPEEKIDNGVGYRVIPKKARSVIVYTIRMPDELIHRAPSYLADRGTFITYNLQPSIQSWLQNFLRTLGYMGLGWWQIISGLGTSTGFAVMAGLGEMCRSMHLVTPEHGYMVRVFSAITDLPLAPGKPIDFGLARFCRVCKKCADYCPAKAIPQSTEPYWWDGSKKYHGTGVRCWPRDEARCWAYIAETNTFCGICMAVCPFSKIYKASYHSLMCTIASTTPALDRFARKMDDVLGYGLRPDKNIEEFWNLDLPPFGWEE